MLNSPFMQAGATKALSKGLLKSSKFSFNGIVTNLEKTVSTINQVVPLYNQVKPLISNSKTLINAFKSTKNTPINKRSRNRNTQQNTKKDFDPNVINVEVNPSPIIPQKNQNPELSTVFTSIDIPNKPFFI